MNQVPDADYIREAERYGVPEVPETICPICKRKCDDYAYDFYGEICGCDKCVKFKDALQVVLDEMEKEGAI